MRLIPTDLTAKRLLVWSVGSIGIMTHTTLLRRIGAFHFGCLYASFGRIPGDLFRNMREVRSTYVGIHGAGLVLHRGNREVFIGDLCVRMLVKTLIDRSIDLLAHMADEAFPALATR